MAIGRYFRGLSAYDLLGNLLPGVVGLLAVLGFTTNPPIPNTIGGVALFAAFAFVLGSIIQFHASTAVGKPRSFVRTMEAAEILPSLSEDQTEKIEHLPLQHALLGPICLWSEPEWGERLDDRILVNRIWEHLVDTYEIPFETDKYGVLYHLMSSKIDGAQSPSRALRMQAIRNFNRGMWIATWYLFVAVGLTLLLDCWFEPQGSILAGMLYTRPSYFTYWTPIWSLWLVSLVGIFVFWGLYRSSEEDYIEYLFTDYAVAITEGKTELSFAEDPVQIAAEHRQDDQPWTVTTTPESTESDREEDTPDDDRPS